MVLGILVAVLIVIGLAVLAILLDRMGRLEREIVILHGRIDDLAASERKHRAATAPPAIPETPRPTLAEPPAPAPGPRPVAAPAPLPVPIPAAPTMRATPTPAPAAPPVAPMPAVPKSRSAEELVGGIWLQNVGSVLLLLGLFFLILWGYNSGRFGPGVLVTAGVVLGIVLAWRGDRVAVRVPAFGHALIGVGLGAAYLSIYLGHFVLGVLDAGAIAILLGLTSMIALAVGQHYRVQSIAILAVLGAFVPQIALVWTGTHPYVQSPALLLLYLAAIDVLVFLLAARTRWAALALLALVLTNLTWLVAISSRPWGWPVTAGLAALFVGLGLAPVPRLARYDEPLRGIDAAVIVLAPYAFILAAWPFLARTDRFEVGWFLLALAVLEAVPAILLERRRANRDLFHVLVTAAFVFLTAAIERLLGSTLSPMGWTLEGIALLSIGIFAGNLWLRALGTFAALLGMITGYPPMFAQATAIAGPPLGAALPALLFTAESVRSLVLIVSLFVGARIVERERARLEGDEATLANAGWLGAANLVLLCWLGIHASRLAGVLLPGSGIAGLPPVAAGLAEIHQARREALLLAICSCAWTLQAFVTLAHGALRDRPIRRGAAYASFAVAAVTCVSAIFAGTIGDAWIPADGVVLHLPGWFRVATLALMWFAAVGLGRVRARLAPRERFAPDALFAVTQLLIWIWAGNECGHLAALLAPTLGSDPAVVTLALVAVAWSIQGFALVAAGCGRRDPWRRATGYLIGAAAALTVASAHGLGAVVGRDAHPSRLLLDLVGTAQLVALLLGLLGATLLARVRDRLAEVERKTPEALTIAVNLLFLLWSIDQSGRIARWIDPAAGERVAAVITSAAWVVQAVLLFLVGWRRASPFLRWLGLGLFGLTLAKLALFDLASVDVFWRFLIAIGFGAVLLAISYVYQRSRLGRRPDDA